MHPYFAVSCVLASVSFSLLTREIFAINQGSCNEGTTLQGMEGMKDTEVCEVRPSPVKPLLTQSFSIWFHENDNLCHLSISSSALCLSSPLFCDKLYWGITIPSYFSLYPFSLFRSLWIWLDCFFFYLNTLLLLSYYTAVVFWFYHHIFFIPIKLSSSLLPVFCWLSLRFSISPPLFSTHCVNPLLSTPSSNSPHPAFLLCHYGYLF